MLAEVAQALQADRVREAADLEVDGSRGDGGRGGGGVARQQHPNPILQLDVPGMQQRERRLILILSRLV